MRRVRLSLLFAIAVAAAGQAARAETIAIGALKDSTIYNSAAAALSNGAGQTIHTGSTNEGIVRRGLIAFDIAGNVPAGSVITGVTLTMNMSQTNSSNITIDSALHRLLADWGEGTSDAPSGEGSGTTATTGDATWLSRFHPDTAWTTPGGDFDAAASAIIGVTNPAFYTWGSNADMVADVQGWLDDPGSNFGWAILTGDDNEAATGKRFDSRQNPTEANRPVLSIEYQAVPEPATWALLALGMLAAARMLQRG